jgi:O-antigen/teichoic acid export membrane protein
MVSRALLQDAAWYALAKGSAGVLGIVTVVFLVRHSGEAAYARYSLAAAAALAVAQWSSGWLYHGIMRYGAQAQSPATASHTRAPIALLLALSLVAAAPLGWGMLAAAQLTEYALVTLGFAAALGWFSLTLGTWQVRLKVARAAAIDGTRAAVSVALILAAALVFPANLAWLLAASALAYLVACVGQQQWFKGDLQRVPWALYWRYGAPLAVWMGLFAVSPFIDRLLLVQLMSDSAAGSYAAAADFVSRAYALLLFPLALASHGRAVKAQDEQSPEAARAIVWRTLRLQACLLLASLPLAWGLGPLLIRGILGTTANASPLFLTTLAASAGLWQLCLLLQKPLELKERTLWLPALMLVALAVQIATGALLIPSWGMQGAALASASGAMAYAFLCLALDRRHDV